MINLSDMVDSVAIVRDTTSLSDVGSFNTLGKNYLARDRSNSAARRLNVECNSEMWREKCMDGNITAFISPRKQGENIILKKAVVHERHEKHEMSRPPKQCNFSFCFVPFVFFVDKLPFGWLFIFFVSTAQVWNNPRVSSAFAAAQIAVALWICQ